MTAAAIARRTPPSPALPPPLSVLLPLMMLLLLLPLPQRTTAAGGGGGGGGGYEEKICSSVVVRNTGDRLAALHNCTTINGYVHIVLLDATKPSDFEVSFPMLREITQYMVVYRVSGLSSLGKLFPNLTLIRGIRTADFPGLALMIHDNADLTEVGLHSLTNITQGSVIITNNPSEYTCSRVRISFRPTFLLIPRRVLTQLLLNPDIPLPSNVWAGWTCQHFRFRLIKFVKKCNVASFL